MSSGSSPARRRSPMSGSATMRARSGIGRQTTSPRMSAVDLALELIRLDTVNPPGNEGVIADLLGGRLSTAGFELAVHEHAPGRPNLIARLPGTDPERPALCMTGHMDTVPL